ncbi:MAG TPA: hypothetical protein VJZ76_03500 [Thermoanaerobaculia bacterium]|nr:hypothetical protein [Thermoanaerobaculia bacterium]
MTLNELWQQVAFAIAGGIAAEILHWYMLTRKPEGASAFAQKPGYWLWTIGMVAVGGLMPALYINGSASALLCFHLGAATPLLIQKLVTTVPAVAAAQGGAMRADGRSVPPLRAFFTW